MAECLRIANCSGFYGDRLSAAREMVEGGPIDVLTGDYLAELTLMILLKDRLKDPSLGYARTFLRQLEEIAATCKERGIKIVVNAGGLNPAGLRRGGARALPQARRAAPSSRTSRATTSCRSSPALQARGEPLAHLDKGVPLATLAAPVLTANAYLGGWGIAAALERGADLVICPRVTDAALTLGPGGVEVRLEARRLGSARRRRRRRARHRVRRAVHRRQLRLLPGGAATSRIPASRSPRCTPTAASSSPSIRAPAAWSRSAPSRRSCSTRSADPRTRTPTSPRASTPSELVAGRARPRARARRQGRAAAADHQGLHQLLRRLQEQHDLRARRARHRGEGAARRGDAVEARRRPRALRGDARVAAARRPPRPGAQRGGVRVPDDQR